MAALFERGATGALSGARIWLSASLPKDLEANEQRKVIDEIRSLARMVFEEGGYVVHGSHPSIVDNLIAEARDFRKSFDSDRRLILVASTAFRDRYESRLDAWRRDAVVLETPRFEQGESVSEEKSLTQMREWISARADALVVLGGRNGQSGGVVEELSLAKARGLPCFLLGGFEGQLDEFVRNDTRIFDELQNGLSPSENKRIYFGVASHRIERIVRKLKLLPLIRGKAGNGWSFRILALDGGGLKGAFTAAVLAQWEEQTGLRIVEHFDLIAGTSTGGILAIGLGMGLTARQLLEFYQKKGPIIFPVTGFRAKTRHFLRHAFQPKYSQEILHREVSQALEAGSGSLMGDSACRLLIPAYYATQGGPHVFRTPHHPGLNADVNVPAASVAVATAAAPTYFKAATIKDMEVNSHYFDGGVWANSPVLAAIVEAVTFLGVPMERLDVLSIGTTSVPFETVKQLKAGIVGWSWRTKILNLLMTVQQQSAQQLAEYLVTNPRYLRIDTTVLPGRYQLDQPKYIEELASLGINKAKEPHLLAQVKSRFLTGVPALPWK